MIEITRFTNQWVAVFGLGKTGISTIRALKIGGANVVAWDDNAAKREAITSSTSPDLVAFGVADTLMDPEEYDWSAISALVLSPGIPLSHPAPHPVVLRARRTNCPILCDIELLYLSCRKARYIGITGTNGKSTTTTLTAHILSTNKVRTEVGGNLGIAALDLNPLGEDGVYVIEASSYQLDLMHEMHFNIATLLNITPDHIDRHGSMENYIAAKERIFRHQQQGDVAIIGVDCPIARTVFDKLKPTASQQLVPISTKDVIPGGVSVIDGVLYNAIGCDRAENAARYALGTLKRLAGTHNGENIAASFAASFCQGLEAEAIINAIQTFPGLKHRLQYIATLHGVRYYNDSKATNAEATEKALLSFPCSIYLILGGKAKEGGIEMLAPLFPRIAHAFLIGEAAQDFATTLEGKVAYTQCGDLGTAFAHAHSMAQLSKAPDAVVLLSPACASFDQWDNFEQRGDAFCAMVHALTQVPDTIPA